MAENKNDPGVLGWLLSIFDGKNNQKEEEKVEFVRMKKLKLVKPGTTFLNYPKILSVKHTNNSSRKQPLSSSQYKCSNGYNDCKTNELCSKYEEIINNNLTDQNKTNNGKNSTELSKASHQKNIKNNDMIDKSTNKSQYKKDSDSQTDIKNTLKSTFINHDFVRSFQTITIAGLDEFGLKKVNQDRYFSVNNVNNMSNFNVFGVLDGHGEKGEDIAEYVADYITYFFENNNPLFKSSNVENIYVKLKENNYRIINDLFTSAEENLYKTNLDHQNSGTTCVVIIQLENHLICANVGDSRAVLVYDSLKKDIGDKRKDIDVNSTKLIRPKLFSLSRDQKPSLPEEKRRIYKLGGVVEKIRDLSDFEFGPERVFAKDKEYPGLSMSRSIGDTLGTQVGVIPDPEVTEFDLNNNAKFAVLCSDGLTEYVSNEEIMEIGCKFYEKKDDMGLCIELVKVASEKWKNQGFWRDDISLIVVFF